MSTTMRFTNTSFVTFIVGKDRTTFQAHESVIFQKSPVFRTAFNSMFKEGRERTMTLPDEDPECFNSFLECLYKEYFDYHMLFSGNTEDMQNCLMRCAQLFVLADKYDVESLKANICGNLFSLAKRQPHGNYVRHHGIEVLLPSSEVIAYIYDHTNRGSPLRKTVADWYAWASQPYEFDERFGSHFEWLYDIPDFGVDVALMLRSGDRSDGFLREFFGMEEEDYCKSIFKEA
ncbi:hypothetical protein ACLMJK_007006 [Lecanora helva]